MHSLQLVQGPGSIRWRSNWDSAVTYYPRDVVRYNSNIFICLLKNTNSAPPNTNWDLFSGPEVYAGSFDQNSIPTTTQVPADSWALWYKTTTGQQFIVRNKSGTIFAVELTPV